MKVSMLLLSFAAFVNVVLAQENPQSLVDLQELRKNLQNAAVERLFRLFVSSSGTTTTTERPRSILPLLARSFKRLNIFGLQAAPDPPSALAGTKDVVPEILNVTPKASSKSKPNFTVVQPKQEALVGGANPAGIPIIINHYPTLNVQRPLPPSLLELNQNKAYVDDYQRFIFH